MVRRVHCRKTPCPSKRGALFFALLHSTCWTVTGEILERMASKGHSPYSDHITVSWPIPGSAEPASCPVYVKLVLCHSVHRKFWLSCPWSGHEGSGTGPSTAQALQASIQTHPLHSAVNTTNSWWRTS